MALANYVGLGILLIIVIAALVFSHIDVNRKDE
jgi:hypothetical protein